MNSWRGELSAFEIAQYVLNLPPTQGVIFDLPIAEKQLRTAAETLNLLDIAYLMLKSAAWRTESRGGHYRTDYPQTAPNWQVHTLVQGDRWWTSPSSFVSD